ncbi:MAG TPA: hypothetical protein VM307_10070 [Egibacteraceae bacterium]|nr:hypothetical protein [Egibacteraceae bacterium]
MRRWKAVACLVAAVIVAGPAAADDFTGSEREYRRLNCPKSGQSVPKNQEPPEKGECVDGATTYMGWVWTNNVKCKSGGTDVAGLAKVYTAQAGTGGGAGVCNDGGTVPIQGRAVVQGSADKGATVYIDGDKDNQPAQLQGFARVDAGPGGVSVRCGDDNGRLDASNPTSDDGQDDCG